MAVHNVLKVIVALKRKTFENKQTHTHTNTHTHTQRERERDRV